MEIHEWVKTDLQKDIWVKKYPSENENFEQWLNRISNGNQVIKLRIKNKDFLFGGRILANRGLQLLGKNVSYSNCYVISSPDDNLESIFDCAKKMARTYSVGGGCGTDLSKLSPRGAIINNASKETTGSVSFMDLYNLTTSLIGMNGRRGALLLTLDCNHPDLLEFVDIKKDLNKINKANISIKMTNDFMYAVKNNQQYTLAYTRIQTGENITKIINARDVFTKIAENNWQMAEPGILFWDRVNTWHLMSELKDFQYDSCNPCCEEPLPPGGSCLLGSINLSNFVLNEFTEDAEFNFDDFSQCVRDAVIALNEVLDEGLSLHPLQEQRESVEKYRQIGLGPFGLADMLIKMQMVYGETESLKLCDKIGYVMAYTALDTSCDIAKEKGCFSAYNENIIKSPFFIYHADDVLINKVSLYGLRNSQLLTCAPTGSISTMIGISGGCEPIYALSYTRKTESLHGNEMSYEVFTPIVQEYMEKYKKKIEYLPSYFITSQQISPKNRILMQAVWQTHIDAAISSTINLPEETTIEDIFNIYLLAWKNQLKGVTIYRKNCSRTGILTTETKNTDAEVELKRGDIINISDDLIGKKRKIVSGCGNLHVQAFFDPYSGDMLETWFSKGSEGGCQAFMIGASRMISLGLRSGVDINALLNQLDSIPTCPSYAVRRATKKDTSEGKNCLSAIGKKLLEMQIEMWNEIEADEEDGNIEINEDLFLDEAVKCPECDTKLIFEGGCNTCKNCGWSKCG